MKKIIGGSLYNTETAHLIKEIEGQELYRTNSRKYFVHVVDQVTGEYITPVTREAAEMWAGMHMSKEEKSCAFGDIEMTYISAAVTPATKKKLDKLKKEKRATTAEIITELIEKA